MQTDRVTVARISTDERTARRLAHLIEETFDGIAASAFEADRGWTFEVILPTATERLAVSNLLEQELGAHAPVTYEQLAERDWVQASLSGLNPVRAGRFFVHGSHDRHRVPANALAIEVEAALAFGTGHHGTTLGCLLALDQLLKRTRPRRVLDVGTGSGVLAIAAALAVHPQIDATDIDPSAVRIARANTSLNSVNPYIRVMAANRLPHHGRYDLILANILAQPLIAMSTKLARILKPHGAIVLSGLLAHQAGALVATYSGKGLSLEKRIPIGGWVTLVMRRRA